MFIDCPFFVPLGKHLGSTCSEYRLRKVCRSQNQMIDDAMCRDHRIQGATWKLAGWYRLCSWRLSRGVFLHPPRRQKHLKTKVLGIGRFWNKIPQDSCSGTFVGLIPIYLYRHVELLTWDSCFSKCRIPALHADGTRAADLGKCRHGGSLADLCCYTQKGWKRAAKFAVWIQRNMPSSKFHRTMFFGFSNVSILLCFLLCFMAFFCCFPWYFTKFWSNR